MTTMSPFANSMRQQPRRANPFMGGIGGLFGGGQPSYNQQQAQRVAPPNPFEGNEQ